MPNPNPNRSPNTNPKPNRSPNPNSNPNPIPNPNPNPNPSYAGPSLLRTFAMAALRYGGPVPILNNSIPSMVWLDFCTRELM